MAVLVAALGYFVDIYDLVLFGVVRVPSLKGIGVPDGDLLNIGLFLLDMQMTGMLLGGLLWGVLGDKRGRLSVLFGSILMYSLANIANGFVTNVASYAVIRFVAGVGLAGELGAGITLVSEMMDRRQRGYGTAIVATVGILGGVFGGLVGDKVDWRTAYFIGGGMGLGLLALRVGVVESGMFQQVKQTAARRGNLWAMLWPPARLRRYVSVILIGIPIWYVVGLLFILAPEMGRALGMSTPPTASRALLFGYAGLAVGDLGSGLLSQWARSRKKVLAGFIVATAFCVGGYFAFGGRSLTWFYVSCALLGISTGYWAVFVTVASEQFGTNIRATVTTTTPNFVRGAVVPLTLAFQAAKPALGVAGAALLVGAVTLVLALVALACIDETFGKDLDFVEQ